MALEFVGFFFYCDSSESSVFTHLSTLNISHHHQPEALALEGAPVRSLLVPQLMAPVVLFYSALALFTLHRPMEYTSTSVARCRVHVGLVVPNSYELTVQAKSERRKNSKKWRLEMQVIFLKSGQ